MKNILSIIFIFFVLGLHAQTDSLQKDSARKQIRNSNIVLSGSSKSDSAHGISDSTKTDSLRISNANRINDNLVQHAIQKNKSKKDDLSFAFPKWFYQHGVAYNASLIQLHESSNTGDIFFYCLLGILLLLGIIKVAFPKYFHHTFQFILQPRVRKRNLRDSSNVSNVAPSILLNILFVITASLCIVQLGKPDFTIGEGWRYWAFCAIAIACIYLIKFVVIKISGWIFTSQEASSIYNYVVFSINKILGVILIPVIILAAYGSPSLVSAIYSSSMIIVLGLLAYRYIASFILMRGNLKVSVFHFFLYLCAIEILPLLVTYKILLIKFGNNI